MTSMINITIPKLDYNQALNILLAQAQSILHSYLTLADGATSFTLGPLTMTSSGNKYTLHVYGKLNGISVFSATYHHYLGGTISFPHTRYADRNTWSLKASSVNTYREGLWVKKLTEAALAKHEDEEEKTKNFSIIEDTEMWDEM